MKSEKALQQAKHHLPRAPEQSFIFNIPISSEIWNFKKIRQILDRFFTLTIWTSLPL